MVFKLLVLGALMAHEGASGHHQVGTGGIECFINKEIFLFPAEVADDMSYILVEIAGDIRSGFVNGVESAQQGGLEVERLSGIGDENRWYAEGLVEDENGG